MLATKTNIMEDEIKRTLPVLKRGGIILYPSDTIWGIGCDATNTEAVQKIYDLKQRKERSSMIVLVDTMYRISHYVSHVNNVVWDLTEMSNRPLTIVYPNAINLPKNLVAKDGSIAIRVVRDEFCKSLIRQLGKPIVSTSANISGRPFPSNFYSIEYEVLKSVDYVADWRQDDTVPVQPSKIVKILENGEIDVLRE